MALSASEVYRLAVDKLRLECSERGVDSSGPVQSLRRRLDDYVKGGQMDSVPDQEAAQASVQTRVMDNVVEFVPPTLGLASHGGGEGLSDSGSRGIVTSGPPIIIGRTGGHFDLVCQVGRDIRFGTSERQEFYHEGFASGIRWSFEVHGRLPA
jgi:hypothetical protein